MQRHDVASTLRRRYIYVMCLPGYILARCSVLVLLRITKIFLEKRSVYFINKFSMVGHRLTYLVYLLTNYLLGSVTGFLGTVL